MKKLLIGFPLVLILTSCATIFSGTTAKIDIATSTGEPAYASVDGKDYYINDLTKGLTKVKVKRGYKKSIIVAENATSQGSAVIKKTFNLTTLLGLPFFGIGVAVDALTGALTKPSSNNYTIHMQPKSEQQTQEPTERVSRDAAGRTDLESTIIRWYFDSDPQGARVFWRVVSSVPAEVKNTNELYLGTTPYEETRSFNIIGLTYENSRDVQIEIKVVRSGYIDQVKRFNVRQAIDQQEINSFFNLISN